MKKTKMTKHFNKDGELESEIYTLPDTNELYWKRYYKGEILQSVYYEKNRKPSRFHMYYENGKLKKEGEWDKDMNVILSKIYDDTGNLTKDFLVEDAEEDTEDEKVLEEEGFLGRTNKFIRSLTHRK